MLVFYYTSTSFQIIPHPLSVVAEARDVLLLVSLTIRTLHSLLAKLLYACSEMSYCSLNTRDKYALWGIYQPSVNNIGLHSSS